MIFKIKHNFVILELIGQPYCHLKRNNSRNLWIKCLINCFRIDSLSSNLWDITTHLSMQHCFHVVFYILGTQYFKIRHPGKDKSFRTCMQTVIVQIIMKMLRPRPRIQSLFLFIFLLFLNQCVLKLNLKTWKEKCKESYLIVVSC